MNIFPIFIPAYDTEHNTILPYNYRNYFLKAYKKEIDRGKTWYAYSVIIHTSTSVEFIAYDMFSFLSGGIGKEIWRGMDTVPATVTKKDIDEAIIYAAKAKREEELYQKEQEIIHRYAEEIRKELNLDTGD